MIKNEKQLNILLTILIFIPAFFIVGNSISVDLYFLVEHGEYVLNNGFPHTEFLTIHKDFNFVMQQWLFSCIIYFVYTFLGNTGTILFVILFYILHVFVLYKICFLITDSHVLSCVTTFIGSILFLIYAESRPHLVSLLMILLTIYCLEKYIKTNKKYYPYFIPILMLIQINCHMTMYPCIFMAIFPYLFNLKVFTGSQITDDFNYNKKPIILSTILSIPMLFLNPYGLDGVLYIFKSMSSTLNIYSMEMMTAAIDNYGGQILLIALIISFIAIKIHNDKIILRHLILFLGAFLLALLTIKNTSLIAISFPIFIASYLRNLKNKNKIIEVLLGYYQVTLPIVISFVIVFRLFNLDDYKMDLISTRYAQTETEEAALLAINYLLDYTQNETDITCYNDLYIGGYLAHKNIIPYIDSRNEIYLLKMNKQYDVLEEHSSLQYGQLDKESFLNKYNFDYFLIKKDDAMLSYLKDNNYNLLYNNDMYYLFENNKN